MNKSAAQESKSPSQLIDARIRELGDWRGKMLSRLRTLVKQADPEVTEEWKWRGVPVWSHDGLICTGETYKSVVKMTFAKGAALPDPSHVFNSSLEGNTRRAIDFHEGDRIDAKALKALVVGLRPYVIVAHSTPINLVLQDLTRTIPIVFVNVTDPIGTGLVESLAHPGGNITGFSNYNPELATKWVETLKEIDRRIERVACVFNPETAPHAQSAIRSIEATQRLFTLMTVAMPVHDGAELERAIADFASTPNGGLIVLADSFAIQNRNSIISLAAKYRVPAIYPFKLFVTAGGLVSYGVDDIDIFRRAASYVDLILKGKKPSDLPVQQPTKYELAINLETAKVLGLDVPWFLQQRADEVIE